MAFPATLDRAVAIGARWVTVATMTESAHLAMTRAAYDTVATDYAALLSTELAAKPLDRGLLATFAELVRAADAGPVADLGCGPGRDTCLLNTLGLDTFGLDLSPRMVEVAQTRYPGLRFQVGDMARLDLLDGVLGGVVAWDSIIHTPPEHLPRLIGELGRVLAPAGHLLLVFRVGDARVRVTRAYGHSLSLDTYHVQPEHVAGLLGRAGLAVHTRVVREPLGRETVPQAYLMARKPAS